MSKSLPYHFEIKCVFILKILYQATNQQYYLWIYWGVYNN